MTKGDAVKVLVIVDNWLSEFYGPVEEYDNDEKGMTQLDHGHEEYEARIAVAAAVRDFFDAQERGE